MSGDRGTEIKKTERKPIAVPRHTAMGTREGREPDDNLGLVAAFAVSLREKHTARCRALEEEHLDQAIEQEVGRERKSTR